MQNVARNIVNGIFKKIGIKLPSFSFNTPFLDNELKRVLDESQERLQKIINQFASIADLDGAFESFIDNMFSVLFGSIPKEMTDCISSLDSSYNASIQELCIFDGLRDASSELFDRFEQFAFSPEITAILTNITDSAFESTEFIFDNFQRAVQIMMPSINDVWINAMKRLPDAVETISEDLNAIFQQDLKCLKQETVQVNFIETFAQIFNLTEKELGIPSCPIQFSICSQMQIPELGTAIKRVKDRIDNLFKDSARYLLVSKGKYTVDTFEQFQCSALDRDFMISFPLPVFKLFQVTLRKFFGRDGLSGILSKILKLLIEDAKLEYKKKNIEALFFSSATTTRFEFGCKEGKFQAKIAFRYGFQVKTKQFGKWRKSKDLGRLCPQCDTDDIGDLTTALKMIEDLFYGNDRYSEIKIGQLIKTRQYMIDNVKLKNSIQGILGASENLIVGVDAEMTVVIGRGISNAMDLPNIYPYYLKRMRKDDGFKNAWDEFLSKYKCQPRGSSMNEKKNILNFPFIFADNYKEIERCLPNDVIFQLDFRLKDTSTQPMDIFDLINEKPTAVIPLLKNCQEIIDKHRVNFGFFLHLFGSENALTNNIKASVKRYVEAAKDDIYFNPSKYVDRPPPIEFSPIIQNFQALGNGTLPINHFLPIDFWYYKDLEDRLYRFRSLRMLKFLNALKRAWTATPGLIAGTKNLRNLNEVIDFMRKIPSRSKASLGYRIGAELKVNWMSVTINLLEPEKSDEERVCTGGDGINEGPLCLDYGFSFSTDDD